MVFQQRVKCFLAHANAAQSCETLGLGTFIFLHGTDATTSTITTITSLPPTTTITHHYCRHHRSLPFFSITHCHLSLARFEAKDWYMAAHYTVQFSAVLEIYLACSATSTIQQCTWPGTTCSKQNFAVCLSLTQMVSFIECLHKGIEKPTQ